MTASLHGLLVARAAQLADQVAIAAPERPPLTYGRLLAQTESVVAALDGLGAVAFLAVATRATCAPLNPAYQSAEFAFYLADLEARALIVQAGVDSPAREAARSLAIPILELQAAADGPAGCFTLAGHTGLPATSPGPAGPDDVALVLHTSGTTARPKIVPLTGRNLRASALHVATALELRRDDRCLCVMPLFHIHGLAGALLASLEAGAGVVCTPGFQAPRFFAWIEECRPTWYTAVPTMHQAILSRAPAHGETIARHPLRLIRSSSAALPPRVMAELEQCFGAPVIEAYGMTEAAHQMASNPLPPRARKPGSVGLAAGPEIAIMGEGGRLLGRGEIGEVAVRGPNITAGYWLNPEATAAAFAGGWFRTGDQGYLDPEGYLFLTGRLRELINRGGEKIAPREVDEALLDHPAVAQAVAFGAPHPRLGEWVAAAVVLRAGARATERDLRLFAGARLAAFKVPGRILIVEAIPRGPTGKLQRIGLAEKLGLGPPDDAETAPDEPYMAPRTPLEVQVAAIWRELLGLELVGVHDDFARLGGDSVLATRIVARVRAATGADISLIDFFEAPTVAGIAAAATTRRAGNGDEGEIQALLAQLESLSDDEARAVLGDAAPGAGLDSGWT